MKIVQLVFVLVAYYTIAAMILAGSEVAVDLDFPELDNESIALKDLSGGCGSFFDCTEYLANVVFNIGAGIINAATFLFSLSVFVIAVLVFVITNSVTGFDGAPWYVNVIVQAPMVSTVAIIAYRLFKSGDSSA